MAHGRQLSWLSPAEVTEPHLAAEHAPPIERAASQGELDLLDAIREAREDLESQGICIDVEAWLAELDSDDE